MSGCSSELQPLAVSGPASLVLKGELGKGSALQIGHPGRRPAGDLPALISVVRMRQMPPAEGAFQANMSQRPRLLLAVTVKRCCGQINGENPGSAHVRPVSLLWNCQPSLCSGCWTCRGETVSPKPVGLHSISSGRLPATRLSTSFKNSLSLEHRHRCPGTLGHIPRVSAFLTCSRVMLMVCVPHCESHRGDGKARGTY